MPKSPLPVYASSTALDEDALLKGDRREFEHLVRIESERLFAVLLRYVRDRDEARSLVQETFLQAYQRLHTFRGESKITTWLYGIGINLAHAHFRKHRREDVLDEAAIEQLQPSFRMGRYISPVQSWSADGQLREDETRRLVRDAIARLPEGYRIIVTLRDMNGFSTDEAAAMLNITPGAARVRLHRARQVLRALLEPYFGSPE